LDGVELLDSRVSGSNGVDATKREKGRISRDSFIENAMETLGYKAEDFDDERRYKTREYP